MPGYSSNGEYTAALCEKVFQMLENVSAQQNVPTFRRSFVGYIDALRSPINTAGTEQIMVQDGSKHKKVRIIYDQRAVESEVTSAEDTTCAPDKYPDFNEVEFDVDTIRSFAIGFDKRQMAEICAGNNASLLQREVLKTFDALARSINKALLQKQLLNFGFNYGNSPASSAAKSINVLVAATGAPLATGLQELIQDFTEKNQYMGAPLVIGQGNIMKYKTTLEAACCNTTGTDMGALMAKLGWAPFLDTQIESVLGSTQFAVLAPGMVQFVPYLRYVGENAGQFGTSVDQVVTDPVTGLQYDMKIDYDGCKEKFYLRLTLNFGLFFQPVDTFNAADPLYRTNGSTRYAAATT